MLARSRPAESNTDELRFPRALMLATARPARSKIAVVR